jgi:hypothetical protein
VLLVTEAAVFEVIDFHGELVEARVVNANDDAHDQGEENRHRERPDRARASAAGSI